MTSNSDDSATSSTNANPNDSVSTGSNLLLLRFFQSEWFTPAVLVSYVCLTIVMCHVSGAPRFHLPTWNSLSPNYGTPVQDHTDQSHLLVTRASTSTALEILLLETAEKSPHTSLQMQFIFQNYLRQFALTPTTDKFRLCQDMFNRILTAQATPPSPKFREHIAPASIVVGGIMGAMAVPALMGLSAQIAGRQARRERPFDDDVGERHSLQRSKSMNLRVSGTVGSPTLKDSAGGTFRAQNSTSLDVRRPVSARGSTLPPTSPSGSQRTSSGTHFSNKHSALMSLSSPNLQPPSPHRPSPLRPVSPANFTDENITRTLTSHYYSTQTQFLQCLQDISLRLRLVPKAARQAALRIELSGLDKWLPADVCLANICSSSEAHDRIVQIVGSDCTILNSAERVALLERSWLTLCRPRNRKHFREIMMSSPSSRQFDLSNTTTHTREKISHDHWHNELSQLKSSEGEDGDLGLRGMNEDVALEFALPTAAPLTPTTTVATTTGRLDSSPRIPPRIGTPVPVDPRGEEMDNLTSHIRSAATMLAQLNSTHLPKGDAQAIRMRILAEMSSLEEQRLALSIATDDTDTSIERTMVDKEDPSAAVFAEDWNAKRERIRKASVWGNLPGWELRSVVVKSDAEMEEAGSQLIFGLKRIWKDDGVDVWLRRMSVLVTSNGYGLIETITGAMSIHSIKKALTSTFTDETGRTKTKYGTLKDHFIQKFGPEKSTAYTAAQLNFIRSLAGYSMATYILNLKDRHNGNILIDEQGHIVHIDFGFFLSNSPGHGMAFELSPFKLTPDYLAIIGPHFPLYTQLLKAAFLSLRRNVEEFVVLVELLQRESKLPSFALGEGTVVALRGRLKLELREREAEGWVDGLVERSRGSAWTRGYDLYQALVNGIRP